MEMNFTPQEMRIISLFIHGLSYGEIALCLKIEETTVSTHLRTIRTKLGTSSSTAIIAPAMHMGFDMDGCFNQQYLFEVTPQRSFGRLPWERKKEQ